MHEEISVGARTRSFTVVSSGTPDPEADLLLVFHGSKQSGQGFRHFTGYAFDALAAGGRTVVAYLDGYRGNWNDGRAPSGFPARVENVDDVGFARAVIGRLASSHGVDPARVFAAGYSNGGEMVMRLLHETPDMLAGAAVYSATMPDAGSFEIPGPPQQPVPLPVLLVHGTKDPIVPYDGGRMSGLAEHLLRVGGTTLSAPDTAAYFARRNLINSPPQTERIPDASAGDRTRLERTDYREPGRPPVRLVTVHGGGHTVPGPGRPPRILGHISRAFSAAQMTGDFLGLRHG
ncbi:alpha/beta hydrolase family esterase [Sediminivirga luteola]|uniref:Phospholipase/carboxylesterase/thioesterase domain-containing protein n=1 Tax=Sediminivirga luteola TaxID=1774748 RepID=A0A8J2XLE5_9MICO|nr:dienelactone hydrolase family protein [Sediminivirga luteola]MCI2266897.1 dienelactone hydrolase family protein [Sediminivirga luteola]GGA21364.1 hypothetical protein GCM10011333_25610 [Sediminivirga luteola]